MRSCFIVLILAFLLCLATRAYGRPPGHQSNPQPAPSLYNLSGSHNVGLLALRVTNSGFFGGGLVEGPQATWRGGEYLSVSGLWIGAFGSGPDPHVSTATGLEFRPELDPRWTLYESFEGMKNGLRVGFAGSAFADDDGDLLIDEDFHNGLDDDGDSRIDEDFAAVGQQNLACMYKDDTPEAIAQDPNHFPLGLLVRQKSYQWSVSGINEFVGVDLEIINTGDQTLRDVYIGLYTDSDVGPRSSERYWEDDLVGWDVIDTTLVDPEIPGPCAVSELTTDAVFMWDAPDNGTSITGGDVPGVFGTILLGHPTDVTGILAPPQIGMSTIDWWMTNGPTTDTERYQVMDGRTRPASNATLPGDYRHLIAVGPFLQLRPGESMQFQTAYVVGDGFSGFRKNVASAQRVFNGYYVDADQNPETGMDGKERCLQVLEPGQPILWDDPCDTLVTTVVYNATPPCNEAGPHYVDSDCDFCTGVMGQETLVNWVGSVAPPGPGTNLDPNLNPLIDPALTDYVPPAGDGRVILQWDNASELWTEPSTGLDIFEGYRIWKVADWQDQITAPGREAFLRIAEFRAHPPGGPGSPGDLENVINPDVDLVGLTDEGKPIYPLGRYEYVDEEVVNDQVYYYAVTAFGFLAQPDTIELAGSPVAPLDFLVIPCDTCDTTTPVRLRSFSARRSGYDAVLRWAVFSQSDHAGFHVHREEPGKERIRLTETLLRNRSRYEFRDSEAPPGAADYWLEERSRTGVSSWHGPARVASMPGFGQKIELGMVSPNPFQSRMTLSYTLPDDRTVQVSIYDLAGRRVRVLLDSPQRPGEYSLVWRGETDVGARAAPGLYLIRLQAGSEAYSRKVLLVR